MRLRAFFDVASKENSLRQLTNFHRINVRVGLACAVLSVLLLYCLLTNKAFRNRQRLIITLAFADFANCIGILLMGVDRINLYTSVLETATVNIENSWSCAIEAWLIVRTIGDLWPPIVQALMGTEQLMNAVTGYRSKNRSDVLVICSILFVVVFFIIGYSMAYSTRADGAVMYYCGRKAAFGKIFSGCIYAHNVVGYVSGVVLNSLAVHQMTRQKPSDDPVVNRRRHEELVQTRSCLLVSCISTVLVSCPNSLSLFSLLVSTVKDSISKPAVWATCVNSGINLFVYFALNNEFRQHVTYLITREEYVSSEAKEEDPPLLLFPPKGSRSPSVLQ